MNTIGNVGMSQYQQYLNPSHNVHAKSSANEEANESPAEKAAEASGTTKNILDKYA